MSAHPGLLGGGRKNKAKGSSVGSDSVKPDPKPDVVPVEPSPPTPLSPPLVADTPAVASSFIAPSSAPPASMTDG